MKRLVNYVMILGCMVVLLILDIIFFISWLVACLVKWVQLCNDRTISKQERLCRYKDCVDDIGHYYYRTLYNIGFELGKRFG